LITASPTAIHIYMYNGNTYTCTYNQTIKKNLHRIARYAYTNIDCMHALNSDHNDLLLTCHMTLVLNIVFNNYFCIFNLDTLFQMILRV